MTPRFPLPSIGRGPVSVGRAVGPAVDLTTPPVTDQLEAHYAARLDPNFSDGSGVSTATELSGNGLDLSPLSGALTPTWADAVFGDIPGIRFADDLLTAGHFLGGGSGEVFIVFRFNTAGSARLFTAVDDTSAFNQCALGTNSDVNLQSFQNSGGGDDRISGETLLSSGTDYIINYRSDGSSYHFYINNSEESLSADSGSNSGDWFGNTGSLNRTCLGGNYNNSSLGGLLDGWIGEVLAYAPDLTADERTNVWSWLNSDVGYGVF